jgi:multiple sugar transport system substrate-binding protein
MLLAVLLAISSLSACSQASPNSEAAGNDKVGKGADTPVTLRMYQQGASLTDDEFQKFLAEPVKQKYPHIAMELVRAQKGVSIQDVLAAGDFPDMIFTGARPIRDFIRLNTVLDLNEPLKKHNIDVNAFNPSVMERIRNLGDKGETYSLPFSLNFSVLFYNKDLFDKFAVSYPPDSMTWDQAIELGKKLARTDGGTVYSPLYVSDFISFIGPLGQSLVDPKTEKAQLVTDGISKAMGLYKRIMDLPGNSQVSKPREGFTENQSIAMLADGGALIGVLDENAKQGKTFNWDVTSNPGLPEHPNISNMAGPFLVAVYSQTKHQDEALKALSVITSEQNQLKITRSGRLSSLKDKKFQDNFGTDLATLKGKNLQAVFKNNPSPTPKESDYEDLAQPFLNSALQKVIKGQSDVNTALREAEDLANKKIADEKGK